MISKDQELVFSALSVKTNGWRNVQNSSFKMLGSVIHDIFASASRTILVDGSKDDQIKEFYSNATKEWVRYKQAASTSFDTLRLSGSVFVSPECYPSFSSTTDDWFPKNQYNRETVDYHILEKFTEINFCSFYTNIYSNLFRFGLIPGFRLDLGYDIYYCNKFRHIFKDIDKDVYMGMTYWLNCVIPNTDKEMFHRIIFVGNRIYDSIMSLNKNIIYYDTDCFFIFGNVNFPSFGSYGIPCESYNIPAGIFFGKKRYMIIKNGLVEKRGLKAVDQKEFESLLVSRNRDDKIDNLLI